MVLGRTTRGRNTDNLGECYSNQTNQQSTSINAPIFTPDALHPTTFPIYPVLGQAQEYAGLHTPVVGQNKKNIITTKISTLLSNLSHVLK